MTKERITAILVSITVFVSPSILYFSNASSSLGFADAAEFALVAKINSVAHPPGFPAYIFFAHHWNYIGEMLFSDTIISLTMFSILCGSLSILLLHLTQIAVFKHTSKNFLLLCLSSAAAVLSVAFGVTFWHWSHNIEVYSLHALAFSMLLYGLVLMQKTGRAGFAIIAGAGLGIGLANHHLTIIFFIPFLLYILASNVFLEAPVKKQKFNVKKFLLNKNNVILVLSSAFFMVLLYYYMSLRAQIELPYKFGNPDNWSRLIYHLSGGAWIKNTAASVSGLVGLRFPYFMQLTFEQIFIFIPAAIWGLALLWKQKMKPLSITVIGYYVIVLLYQLRIDQTADTDAYMILPFMLFSFPITYALYILISRYKKTIYLIPLLIAIHLFVNFNKTDARDFNVSESLMKMLDESAPKGAVIMISDWTLVSQYHYYRVVNGFRPDLIVLNYDIKFTNYQIVPSLYPAFYDSIRVQYNDFINKLGRAHPQEIYNTGCTLDTPELMESYKTTVRRIQNYCTANGKAFMVDPKAFVFMLQSELMTTSSHVSGCFVSTVQTGLGRSFVDLPFDWLYSPLLYRQPACTDKIVDIEAMLDFNKNYYKSTGDVEMQQKAERSFVKIKSIQRKIKKRMPFVYRPQGQ
jgi:transmembrane protein TMEM260 (protein O-mannosyltransferase)